LKQLSRHSAFGLRGISAKEILNTDRRREDKASHLHPPSAFMILGYRPNAWKTLLPSAEPLRFLDYVKFPAHP
jgi:hypothetical protein